MHYIILCLIILADQISKYWVRHAMLAGESLPIIKNVFHLSLVFNRGVAFGMFKQGSMFFILVALAAIVVIFVNLKFKSGFYKNNWLQKYSLLLILAGATGNLIDRLVFGYVIDFLDFRFWPVFNIADSAITIGACILVFGMFKKSKRARSV